MRRETRVQLLRVLATLGVVYGMLGLCVSEVGEVSGPRFSEPKGPPIEINATLAELGSFPALAERALRSRATGGPIGTGHPLTVVQVSPRRGLGRVLPGASGHQWEWAHPHVAGSSRRHQRRPHAPLPLAEGTGGA